MHRQKMKFLNNETTENFYENSHLMRNFIAFYSSLKT